MSRDTIFTAGSMAKSYVEVADWYGRHTENIGAKTICMPCAGFGRIASAMCQTDTAIYTFEYQHILTAIIRGVFGAKEFHSNVDKPRFHKGPSVEGNYIRGIDMHSAGFIDWIVKYGTDLDVAAIGMAIPGQTMRGWLSKWTGNFDSLWEKFYRVREEFRLFINMPGCWYWNENDVFKALRTDPVFHETHFDVLAFDPPRLGAGGQDSYSAGGWPKLNAMLGGTAKIKPWTARNYLSNLTKLIDTAKSDYLLFTWQEGNPPLEVIKNTVLAYGTLEDETIWETYNKTIHGWRVKRT